ncbi:DUF1266 domain-containing protein [Candidatus Allofournierella excrementigallinarum]|uniref:DUF1266 domain-containing protein n=1 Tax=Candidatus Allofournierella excrementigallinarum TaxID=2838592 RepID=UPI00374ECDB3
MDVNEIMNRAKAARAQALESLHKTEEKAEALADSFSPEPAAPAEEAAAREAQQMAANDQRQVEILGQVFDSQTMEQMAANQEQLQRMMEQRVAEAACASADAMMDQLFGEDMGVLAAALETLAMDDDSEGADPDEEETDDALYTLLDETLARLETLPEPAPAEYGRDPALWERFGILLSGIVSTLNDHSLEGLDVEEHIPVLEQQVLSVVRRSWGIDGRGGLLETLRYLGQGGYAERYRFYCEAETPEELMTGDEDEDGREGVIRAWAFARHYRERYSPAFMAGWDMGRAAMLARWGSYLGWITPEEAQGILWDLAQRAARDLGGWREFAQSYLFGGLMWKLLCNSPAAGYLGYLADAATALLVGKADGSGGQWRGFPWPARRKLGFTL